MTELRSPCTPYHFRMDETPSVVEPELSIPGFYDADRRETLLLVPLRHEVDIEKLQQFIAELQAQALVFLRSIRRLTFTDIASGETTIEHRLRERERSVARLCCITSSTKPSSIAVVRSRLSLVVAVAR
jgi:hypothetical protein